MNDGHYEFDNADGGAAESVAKENDTGDTEEYEYAYEEEFWVPASQETELKLQLDKFLRIPVVEEEDLK